MGKPPSCFRLNKQCWKQRQICSCTKRKTYLLRGGGGGGKSHPSAPKLAPWSQGAERVPDLGRHVASLSPKKWEPPVLFSPSPRGRRPGDGGWGCGEGGVAAISSVAAPSPWARDLTLVGPSPPALHPHPPGYVWEFHYKRRKKKKSGAKGPILEWGTPSDGRKKKKKQATGASLSPRTPANTAGTRERLLQWKNRLTVCEQNRNKPSFSF